MRALSSLLLAGAVGLGGLALVPTAAEAHGGWRGRDHYGSYLPPPPRYYGYGYGPPAYYRPPPPAFYRPPPPPVFYRPPAFYGPPAYGPPARFYGPPAAFYGPPRSYGIPPGPGVGLWIR